MIPVLEEFLNTIDSHVTSDKKLNADFSSLLKKKFVEKADKYPFLDPFLAEFEYSNRKISYNGDVDNDRMAQGVLECCRELADEIGIARNLKEALAPWLDKYARRLSSLGVSF